MNMKDPQRNFKREIDFFCKILAKFNEMKAKQSYLDLPAPGYNPSSQDLEVGNEGGNRERRRNFIAIESIASSQFTNCALNSQDEIPECS